ncbi:MAG: RnfABCDGE type electron transport complex subunit D [Armatimonadota bacterium]|nr:MAG: RnfABCDGE type electron transport complex subunit D [Armatimonadota bacterium]
MEDTAAEETGIPTLHVAPSPHLSATAVTTRWMMRDVLIGLAPVMAASVFLFRWYAVAQVGLCVLTCLTAEAVFTWMRGKPARLGDLSAAVTGVILGLSLPWSAPWYVAVIGAVVAIGLGKMVFGGLGYNIFNPAMVGRAFVMLSFAKALGASAYVSAQAGLTVVTQATPLTAAKQFAATLATGRAVAGDVQLQFESARALWPLFVGQVNGSLGETSALAVLIGGIYLCARRSASWEIPTGVILSAFLLSGAANWAGVTPFAALHHVVGGALLFGAFFIATDPVTTPLTTTGKFIFGLGVGALVIMIRVFSSYPEGVMFAVLVMNAVTPLLNRWTIPRPVGGPVPART